MRLSLRRVLFIGLFLAALLLSAPALYRAWEATWLLADVAGLQMPGQFDARPAVERGSISYTVDVQQYDADLYQPANQALAGIVLVHGAAQLGKDEPRLAAFATTLAGGRFAVLVPDLVQMRNFKIKADEVQAVADAVRYLRSRSDLLPGRRVGLVAFSVSVGIAILTALEPELRDQVQFVLAVGGYYDLRKTITYTVTGYHQQDGEWRYLRQNEYGKWVFLLSNVERLQNPRDRSALRAIAQRRMQNPSADISDLLPELSDTGRRVYRAMSNPDPERSAELLAQLPSAIQTDMDELDLANKELTKLKARLLLVHGYDDNIIPYTESLSLAQALPKDQVELFLIKGLNHVDTDADLLDGWRLWHALYALLRERDA